MRWRSSATPTDEITEIRSRETCRGARRPGRRPGQVGELSDPVSGDTVGVGGRQSRPPRWRCGRRSTSSAMTCSPPRWPRSWPAYNGRATSLAVTAFAVQASIVTATPIPVELGSVPDDAGRLAKAATTVLDGGPRLRCARGDHRRLGRVGTVEHGRQNLLRRHRRIRSSPRAGRGRWTPTRASCASGGGVTAGSGPKSTRSRRTRAAPAYPTRLG